MTHYYQLRQTNKSSVERPHDRSAQRGARRHHSRINSAFVTALTLEKGFIMSPSRPEYPRRLAASPSSASTRDLYAA